MAKYPIDSEKYSRNFLMKMLEKRLDPNDVNRMRDLNETYPDLADNINKNTPVPYNQNFVRQEMMMAQPQDNTHQGTISDITNRMYNSLRPGNEPFDYNMDALNDEREFKNIHPVSPDSIIDNQEDVNNFKLSDSGKFNALRKYLRNK